MSPAGRSSTRFGSSTSSDPLGNSSHPASDSQREQHSAGFSAAPVTVTSAPRRVHKEAFYAVQGWRTQQPQAYDVGKVSSKSSIRCSTGSSKATASGHSAIEPLVMRELPLPSQPPSPRQPPSLQLAAGNLHHPLPETPTADDLSKQASLRPLAAFMRQAPLDPATGTDSDRTSPSQKRPAQPQTAALPPRAASPSPGPPPLRLEPLPLRAESITPMASSAAGTSYMATTADGKQSWGNPLQRFWSRIVNLFVASVDSVHSVVAATTESGTLGMLGRVVGSDCSLKDSGHSRTSMRSKSSSHPVSPAASGWSGMRDHSAAAAASASAVEAREERTRVRTSVQVEIKSRLCAAASRLTLMSALMPDPASGVAVAGDGSGGLFDWFRGGSSTIQQQAGRLHASRHQNPSASIRIVCDALILDLEQSSAAVPSVTYDTVTGNVSSLHYTPAVDPNALEGSWQVIFATVAPPTAVSPPPASWSPPPLSSSSSTAAAAADFPGSPSATSAARGAASTPERSSRRHSKSQQPLDEHTGALHGGQHSNQASSLMSALLRALGSLPGFGLVEVTQASDGRCTILCCTTAVIRHHRNHLIACLG
jgi:hypothetical protein